MKKECFDVCFFLHADYGYVEKIKNLDIGSIYNSIFFNLHDILPELQFSIAPSGAFIEWAKCRDEPILYWMRSLATRGQVEFVGGAFYEPFFSAIPTGDLFSQIELLTESFRAEFGRRPHGAYPPYSAWDESCIDTLKKNGMSYCLLDSRLFVEESIRQYEPLSIEHNGKAIFALPLEYSVAGIDKFSPKAFFEYVLNLNKLGNSCLIVPLTKEVLNKCLKKKGDSSWFEQFIALIKGSSIKISKIQDVLRGKRIYQKGIISSNAVLNSKAFNSSIKKAIFSYPHLAALYSKSLYVHFLCNQVRGDKARKNSALEDLWQAESAVWFNLEGENNDIAPSLLQTAYRHLLLSEKQARTQGVFSASLLNYDFNMDGLKEFLFQQENMNMYIHNLGGKVFELDVFNVYKNYTYQIGEHALFVDHLLTKRDMTSQIKAGNLRSITTDSVFANNFYQDISQNKIKMDLAFSTESALEHANMNLFLKKKYKLEDNVIEVQYFLKNDSKKNLTSYFMIEFSLSFEVSSKKKSSISIYSKEVMQEIPIEDFSFCPTFSSVSWVQMQGIEKKMKFVIELNEVANVILLPIYRKYGEAIKENIIGVRLLFYWEAKLRPHRDTEKMVLFKLFDIKKQ